MISVRNEKGFSLIELIVAVAILGTLAAIMIPMYTEHKKRTFRNDAKAVLLQEAHRMERFFTRNSTYEDADLEVPSTQGGTYTLQFGDANVDGTNNAVDTFEIQAVPTGSQVGDRCGTLSIDRLGRKTAAEADCW